MKLSEIRKSSSSTILGQTINSYYIAAQLKQYLTYINLCKTELIVKLSASKYYITYQLIISTNMTRLTKKLVKLQVTRKLLLKTLDLSLVQVEHADSTDVASAENIHYVPGNQSNTDSSIPTQV